jgi:RNA polymerase-binding transcription factor DksA
MVRRTLERDLEVTAARVANLAEPDPSRLKQHFHRVWLALLRMRAHNYGKCAACGKPLTDARLKLMPTAGACGACQRAIDRSARNAD